MHASVYGRPEKEPGAARPVLTWLQIALAVLIVLSGVLNYLDRQALAVVKSDPQARVPAHGRPLGLGQLRLLSGLPLLNCVGRRLGRPRRGAQRAADQHHRLVDRHRRPRLCDGLLEPLLLADGAGGRRRAGQRLPPQRDAAPDAAAPPGHGHRPRGSGHDPGRAGRAAHRRSAGSAVRLAGGIRGERRLQSAVAPVLDRPLGLAAGRSRSGSGGTALRQRRETAPARPELEGALGDAAGDLLHRAAHRLRADVPAPLPDAAAPPDAGAGGGGVHGSRFWRPTWASSSEAPAPTCCCAAAGGSSPPGAR